MERLGTRDRFLAWIVTGPVGRFVAFFWDFGAALLSGARNRVTKLRRR
jgi:hypothetical protein